MKRQGGSYSTQAGIVTAGDVPYSEPPRPSETGSYGAWRSEETFRKMLAAEAVRSQPLTAHERELLRLQRANPGPLLPELAQLQLDRALEQQRREQSETSYDQPLKPESRLDPSSQDSIARRGRVSRQRNRPVDPHLSILRPPGQPGHGPWDNDEPECFDGTPWKRW